MLIKLSPVAGHNHSTIITLIKFISLFTCLLVLVIPE